MKIIECRWALVTLERKRIILALKNEEGREAFSEISPYPPLSKETFEEALEQLKKVAPLLTSTALDLSTLNLFPSVAFGIKAGFDQLTDPMPAFSCSFSALFQGSVKEIYRQAQRAFKWGIKSAKLKIGFLSLEEAKELVTQLKSLFYLRIDLNERWEAKEVFRFFSSYAPNDFDYIEDPLKDPVKLLSFLLPFAIDAKGETAPSLPMKALVVKPTILKQIPATKKPIVLSSCFDTGLNIFHLATLAKRLNLQLPQGLGPYLFLENDILEQQFTVQNGLIQFPEKISLDKKIYASLSPF
ncbi:MAG TPA: enolase C-terminal domain-like protein [Rhabdochlamydiaceae bacterium]|nr:enolase C-terminal domain-like protein [Rhabdochlamydiaceae bacterium]